MKTVKSFFLAFILILAPHFIFSQIVQPVAIAERAVEKEKWAPVENWQQTFRTIFGKDASTNWMSELAIDATFYQQKETGGLIAVLPNYIQGNNKLQAKLQYGIFENKNTKLLPLEDEATFNGSYWTTRYLGYLGGMPTSLDMVVIEQGKGYLTVMGFYPGQELTTEFSEQFHTVIEQQFKEKAFASR